MPGWSAHSDSYGNCRPRRPAPPAGPGRPPGRRWQRPAHTPWYRGPPRSAVSGAAGTRNAGPSTSGAGPRRWRRQHRPGAGAGGCAAPPGDRQGRLASPWKRESLASGPSPGPPRPDGPVCPPAGKGCPIHPSDPRPAGPPPTHSYRTRRGRYLYGPPERLERNRWCSPLPGRKTGHRRPGANRTPWPRGWPPGYRAFPPFPAIAGDPAGSRPGPSWRSRPGYPGLRPGREAPPPPRRR